MKRSKDELPTSEPPTVTKIRAALEDLDESWMYGHEFREYYGLSDDKVAKYRRRYFAEYSLSYPPHVIWSGSKQTIKSLEEKINAKKTHS